MHQLFKADSIVEKEYQARMEIRRRIHRRMRVLEVTTWVIVTGIVLGIMVKIAVRGM